MPPRLYVVADNRGRCVAARIARRDYDGGNRSLAAAALLVGHRVAYCIIVERTDDERVLVMPVPRDLSCKHIDRAAVGQAVRACRRSIETEAVSARLKPAKISTLDLFGASA